MSEVARNKTLNEVLYTLTNRFSQLLGYTTEEFALRQSIVHWNKNTTVKLTNHAVTGSNGCECCANWFDDGCIGCPIFKFTGAAVCSKTPYTLALKAKLDGELSAFRLAAQMEVDFLSALASKDEDRARDICAAASKISDFCDTADSDASLYEIIKEIYPGK